MTKHITAIEVSFENLNSSIAWANIREYVKENLEQEQQKFFSMEDSDGGDTALREQRLKVKHYRELWETIQLYVLNSTRKGGNRG